MNGLHGILFACRRTDGLRELVDARMSASLPFGGRYRAVDFMLSNLANAEVSDVGVVMQGSYQSLLDHLSNASVWDMTRKLGGLKLLPPYSANRGEYRGWMEALAILRGYLRGIRQDYVLLSFADTIINIPLRSVLDAHIASGADITAVCTSNPDEDGEELYFTLSDRGDITDVRSGGRGEDSYRSLDIFILSKTLLLDLVEDCAAHERYSFSADVLHARSGELRMRAYVWDGYAARIRTLRRYYACSMDLLKRDIRGELFSAARPIRAKEDDEAATYVDPDGSCTASLLGDGCMIEGTVENSILFPGVTVERGAVVRGCILMKNTLVRRGAQLTCVIADKNVQFCADARLMGSAAYPLAIAKGSVV